MSDLIYSKHVNVLPTSRSPVTGPVASRSPAIGPAIPRSSASAVTGPATSHSSASGGKGAEPSNCVCAPAPYVPIGYDDTNNSDAQHAVIATLDKLWDVGYNNSYLKSLGLTNDTDGGTVVLFYQFLKTTGTATSNMQSAVTSTIITWQECANVLFVHLTSDLVKKLKPTPSADIRIKFSPSGGSWSIVGQTTQVQDSTQPTLNLGWLKDSATPSDNDKGTILHEFGHVLGMMHEHQSPARGEKITLKTDEVYKFYLPLLHYDRDLVWSQVINVYNSDQSNFSHFDQTSIMMYFMPAYLNYENIEVKVNVQLSELDKAYVGFAYPRKDQSALLGLLGTVGVSDDDSNKILEPLLNAKTNGLKDSDILRIIRQNFFDYNKNVIEAAALLNAKNHSQKSVAAPYNRRDNN